MCQRCFQNICNQNEKPMTKHMNTRWSRPRNICLRPNHTMCYYWLCSSHYLSYAFHIWFICLRRGRQSQAQNQRRALDRPSRPGAKFLNSYKMHMGYIWNTYDKHLKIMWLGSLHMLPCLFHTFFIFLATFVSYLFRMFVKIRFGAYRWLCKLQP